MKFRKYIHGECKKGIINMGSVIGIGEYVSELKIS